MRGKILTQEHLKLLACLLMLLDHIGYMNLIPGFYTELRAIGRLAFPIFCFLLCEGFIHTRSKKKYLIRLGIGMLLAEIPFDLFIAGHITFTYQSVMVTLFLAFVMAMLMERTNKMWLKVLLVVPFYFLADFLKTDYAGAGILMAAIFLLTDKLPNKLLWQTGLMLIAQFFVTSAKFSIFGIRIPIQIFAVFAMLPIALYNGRKTSHNPVFQWAFYLFYPVHMLILSFFR